MVWETLYILNVYFSKLIHPYLNKAPATPELHWNRPSVVGPQPFRPTPAELAQCLEEEKKEDYL